MHAFPLIFVMKKWTPPKTSEMNFSGPYLIVFCGASFMFDIILSVLNYLTLIYGHINFSEELHVPPQ